MVNVFELKKTEVRNRLLEIDEGENVCFVCGGCVSNCDVASVLDGNGKSNAAAVDVVDEDETVLDG